MKSKFNKGSELDKQIYKEGEPTWGCKSGVLDAEDVKDFIQEIYQDIYEILRNPDKSILEKLALIQEDIKSKSGDGLI